MKKLLTALLVLCTGAGGVFGLFASSNEPVKLPEDWGDVLVVYYSATGSTEKIAGYIADATGGDVFELVPAEPYTSADLNWRKRLFLPCPKIGKVTIPCLSAIPSGGALLHGLSMAL